MGIPKFLHYLFNANKNINDDKKFIKYATKIKVDNFYVDHSELYYSCINVDAKKIIPNILEQIKNLLDYFQTNVLIYCHDGVCPVAKMQTLRHRRFRKSQKKQEYKDKETYEREQSKILMINDDDEIKNFFKNEIISTENAPIKIYHSTSHAPGHQK